MCFAEFCLRSHPGSDQRRGDERQVGVLVLAQLCGPGTALLDDFGAVAGFASDSEPDMACAQGGVSGERHLTIEGEDTDPIVGLAAGGRQQEDSR